MRQNTCNPRPPEEQIHGSEESAETPCWQVYLVSCRDGSLYCGVTQDISRRVAQHNGEKPGGARYTRARRPVRLRGLLPCGDKSMALALERYIKSLPTPEKKLQFFAENRAVYK